MGLSPSKESEIIGLIRQDNARKLQDFLINNNINRDALYTNRKRNLIQLCCYYESPKCVAKLIKMNYDYNKKEISNNYTPLYIACKFNCLEIVKTLLSQKDIILLQKNDENFNEFEIAFLKGNYDICYYLLYEYKKDDKINKNKDSINLKENKNDINTNKEVNNGGNEDKENNEENEDDEENEENEENVNNNENIEINMNNPYQKFFFSDKFNLKKYLSLQSSSQCPLFNMKLFYKSLYNKIPPKQCANSLPAERKKTKNLQTKIPDPNETWGHFFKRVATMDLYNPPLVDKKNVSQMNSLYMSTQMKLMENEYGIKMSYYNPNENTRNVFKDEEAEDDNPIFNIQNTEKKRLKEESQNDKDNKNNANNSDNVSDNNTSNNVLNIPMSKRNKQRKLEEIKLGSKDNIVININNTNKSSDRPIIKKNNNEDEDKV